MTKQVLNSVNSELFANDRYEGRCGEIFITQKSGVIIHCSLCDCRYVDYKQFLAHALTRHYYGEAENKAYTVSMPAVEELRKERQRRVPVATEEKQQTITVDIKLDEDCDEYELFQVEDGQLNSVEQSQTVSESNQLEEETIEIDPVYETEYDIKNTSFDVPGHRQQVAIISTRTNLRPSCAKHVEEVSELFINSKTFKAHTKANSNQTRKFQCEHCGFAFKEEYNLRAHLRRHTSPKQFSCAQCPKKFHTRSELSIHGRRHTGERPFVCTLCNVGFVTSGALCDHVKRHTNNRTHKCGFCEKGFYDTYQLKEHLVVHTQERNHTCNVCNAAFSRHKSLVVHMKLHANERQYICEICKISFNQKQALASHFKSKHKQNNHSTGEIEEKESNNIVTITANRKNQESKYKDSMVIEDVQEYNCGDLIV